MSSLERFESKCCPEPNTGCWLWTGFINPKGYGKFSDRRANIMAHRWAYEFFIGPIPDGFTIDHLCRQRCCVNPEHLEAVSHAENVRRGSRATSTHCKRGHPLSGENLIQLTRGRDCRECQRAAKRAYVRRKRAGL